MRVQGIDVARGMASIVMIQGHAYHAWVKPELHGSTGYRFTRLLGTLPLPAFLVLAGAAVMWRVEVAAARGEDARGVRRGIVRRGFEILLWGYLVSGLYMLMDGGEGLVTLLRADVLHVIGLSIAIVGGLGIYPDRGSEAPSPSRFAWTAALVAIPTTLACPWLSRLSADVTGPMRYQVALFADVPGVTKMPFVPLVAWFAAGALAAFAMWRAREQLPESAELARRVGAAPRFGAALLIVSLAMTFASERAMNGTMARLGGTLSRAHPAVWFNVTDLAGRGLAVLALGMLMTPYLSTRARGMLIRMGQGSLVAYVFHIPFCYGALGAGIRGELDMMESSALVLLLIVVSYLVVWLRDELRLRLRAGRGGVAQAASTLLVLALGASVGATGCSCGSEDDELADETEALTLAEPTRLIDEASLERGPQLLVLHRPLRVGQRFREDTELNHIVRGGDESGSTTLTFQAIGEVKGVDERGLATRIEYEILDLIHSTPTGRDALVPPGTRIEVVRSIEVGHGRITSGGRAVVGEAGRYLMQLISTSLQRRTDDELWAPPGAVEVGRSWDVDPAPLIEAFRELSGIIVRPENLVVSARFEDVLLRDETPTQAIEVKIEASDIRRASRQPGSPLGPRRVERTLRFELPVDSEKLPRAFETRFISEALVRGGRSDRLIVTETTRESRFLWL